jgi:putative FmdB family regulatory protein
MPTYAYCCKDCGYQVLENRAIDERDSATHCPKCNAVMYRPLNFGVVTFKGSGFYRNDK